MFIDSFIPLCIGAIYSLILLAKNILSPSANTPAFPMSFNNVFMFWKFCSTAKVLDATSPFFCACNKNASWLGRLPLAIPLAAKYLNIFPPVPSSFLRVSLNFIDISAKALAPSWTPGTLDNCAAPAPTPLAPYFIAKGVPVTMVAASAPILNLSIIFWAAASDPSSNAFLSWLDWELNNILVKGSTSLVANAKSVAADVPIRFTVFNLPALDKTPAAPIPGMPNWVAYLKKLPAPVLVSGLYCSKNSVTSLVVSSSERRS